MRIGILASGLMGAKLGTIFARAGTPADAARDADALPLAVHWSNVDEVLKQAGDLSGKVIVTCSLPMNADDTGLVIAHTSSGAEALAKKARRARVVSAFGTVPSEVSFGVFAAKRKANRPNVVYCGDDQGAKDVAATLIRDTSYQVVRSGRPDFTAECSSSASSETCFVDASAPAPGQAFYFLVRPLTPHAGGWGQDSSGHERAGGCLPPPLLPARLME